MRFRLRYLQHDLELTEGPFAVGRNATCQLSLDDPLVSRRHAIFTVREDQVEVEDLESRNGVLVNGQKITGRVRLQAGDKVLIGSQEMVLMQAAAGRVSNPVPPLATLTRMPSAHPEDPSVVTKVSFVPQEAMEELSVVKRLDGFRVLGSVAEKALAMGRPDEAERVLAASLVEVLDMVAPWDQAATSSGRAGDEVRREARDRDGEGALGRLRHRDLCEPGASGACRRHRRALRRVSQGERGGRHEAQGLRRGAPSALAVVRSGRSLSLSAD